MRSVAQPAREVHVAQIECRRARAGPVRQQHEPSVEPQMPGLARGGPVDVGLEVGHAAREPHRPRHRTRERQAREAARTRRS